MKFLLLLIPLLLAFNLRAQSKKWEAGTELSVALSNVTNPPFFPHPAGGFQVSQNIFVKGGYSIKDRLWLTGGAGYLATDQVETLLLGFNPGANQTQINSSHHYIVFPIGVKYFLGSFFINPELSIAFENGHYFETEEYYFSENSVTILGSTSFLRDGVAFNSVTYPVFLNFGNEFNLGKIKLIVGFKGYYSLNNIGATTNERHYYGFGLMTGVKL